MPLGQIWINLPKRPTGEPAERNPGGQAPPIFIPSGERESVQELKTKICIHKLPVYIEPEPESVKPNFDPILISLVRRVMPDLIAYDICGVQPMTGSTGLIFTMRSKYENDRWTSDGVQPLTAPSQKGFELTTVNAAKRKEQAVEYARTREELRKRWSAVIYGTEKR